MGFRLGLGFGFGFSLGLGFGVWGPDDPADVVQGSMLSTRRRLHGLSGTRTATLGGHPISSRGVPTPSLPHP